jgi:hypothetical protein
MVNLPSRLVSTYFGTLLLLLLLLLFNCNSVDARWQQYSTHLHTNSTQNTEDGAHIIIKKKKIGKCGPCPVFVSYALAFALQLKKKQGKTSVRVVEKCPDIPVAVVLHYVGRTWRRDEPFNARIKSLRTTLPAEIFYWDINF